jgi:hypothetical protein
MKGLAGIILRLPVTRTAWRPRLERVSFPPAFFSVTPKI